LEIPSGKLTPDLRWPVFTRKSMAGFAGSSALLVMDDA
jgi:hypothetical protein